MRLRRPWGWSTTTWSAATAMPRWRSLLSHVDPLLEPLLALSAHVAALGIGVALDGAAPEGDGARIGRELGEDPDRGEARKQLAREAQTHAAAAEAGQRVEFRHDHRTVHIAAQ